MNVISTEVTIDIGAIVRQCEHELGRTLPTWKDRMEAVAAGAIDNDDAVHLIELCALLADEVDCEPQDWLLLVHGCFAGQYGIDEETLIEMGVNADRRLADEAKK